MKATLEPICQMEVSVGDKTTITVCRLTSMYTDGKLGSDGSRRTVVYFVPNTSIGRFSPAEYDDPDDDEGFEPAFYTWDKKWSDDDCENIETPPEWKDEYWPIVVKLVARINDYNDKLDLVNE